MHYDNVIFLTRLHLVIKHQNIPIQNQSLSEIERGVSSSMMFSHVPCEVNVEIKKLNKYE